ncbi:MAG: sigma-70 family RNA polymerase sigma factor [Acidobacteriota bacterium]|nr:sigma-70 family RNA polymerase sigma factor [Acidobacteriota bacterium]
MSNQGQPDEPRAGDETMLVLLAQAGDRKALGQLLHGVYAPLRAYVSRLAGADLADDILQETSIQILRKLGHLREPAVFRPWSYRIASRIAFAHLKRAQRWRGLDDAKPEQLVARNMEPVDLSDESFMALIEQLSPASRAVVLLHYQHDLSLEESAAVLGIPLGTVKSRLHYGVAALRKQFISERKPA